MKREKTRFDQGVAAIAVAVLAILLLGGCGGGSSRVDSPALQPGSQPVQLGARQHNAARPASVLRTLDEAQARKGIENYAINKKRAAGKYRLAGADLNEDGVAEAMVLFEGKDWCAKNGCSLAILRAGSHGFEPISRTVRVKAPVVISGQRTGGWRDLFVSTGGDGSAPLRRVRLRFSANGYTRNAMLENEIPPDVPQFGDVAFPAKTAPGAGARASRRP